MSRPIPPTMPDTRDTRDTSHRSGRWNTRARGREPTSIPIGALWMVVITVGLFFLPAINGVIGGFVGGYKVGSVGRALLAALVPFLVVGAALWVLLVAIDLPVLGAVAGFGAAILIAASNLGLFIGALLGGLVSR